ncbi:MAG: hypothetical protein JOS17DRAFT_183600 [Linnemannia elongata]|nr:MAG: hypothetical protein JOS17DRAFT_183600 [Linnemannia elongata]
MNTVQYSTFDHLFPPPSLQVSFPYSRLLIYVCLSSPPVPAPFSSFPCVFLNPCPTRVPRLRTPIHPGFLAPEGLHLFYFDLLEQRTTNKSSHENIKFRKLLSSSISNVSLRTYATPLRNNYTPLFLSPLFVPCFFLHLLPALRSFNFDSHSLL